MGLWNGARAAVSCAVVLALVGCAHPGAATPQPPVNRDAKEMASFVARVKEYVDLHNKLEATLPHLPREASPQQIDSNQRALQKLIQENRRMAKKGDVFTPESRRVIVKLMSQVFGGADGRQLRDSIMDENPGNLHLAINARYPDAVPLSTVPPQVLAGLPRLPDDLEFRFIGRRLILMDVHAHTIVDYIDDAIPA